MVVRLLALGHDGRKLLLLVMMVLRLVELVTRRLDQGLMAVGVLLVGASHQIVCRAQRLMVN